MSDIPMLCEEEEELTLEDPCPPTLRTSWDWELTEESSDG